jgi:NAD(P)-dependent dehydrogenase (short-subunit alcohol dehydrogenase family)
MNEATTALDNSFRLDGRVAFVTGASSGIGQALALAFARAGARVALTARRVDRLAKLAEVITGEGGQALAVALDVTDRAAITRAFDDVAAQLGIPDLILNNAGLATPALFLKTDAATLESTMATNFTAAWNVSQEAARRLVAAKRGGSIINITSVLGIGVGAGHAAYSASKAALAHATRAMALEFVRYGIRVNGIAPGWFVTEMNTDFFATAEGVAYLKKTPPGRAGRLEELVGPALLLASDAGSFVNGVILPVDGGHHAALV